MDSHQGTFVPGERAKAACIDRQRLLQWVLAWAGLSATWMLEDNQDASTTLAVAQLAALALGISDDV